MGHTHWTEDELLDRLYGLAGDGDEAACPACRTRWEELMRRRERLGEPPTLPAAFLAAQRRAIWERIEQRPRVWRWRLVPVLPVLLAAAFFLQPPAPQRYPEVAIGPAGYDQAWFEQVFREAARTEPLALSPARELFEVRP